MNDTKRNQYAAKCGECRAAIAPRSGYLFPNPLTTGPRYWIKCAHCVECSEKMRRENEAIMEEVRQHSPKQWPLPIGDIIQVRDDYHSNFVKYRGEDGKMYNQRINGTGSKAQIVRYDRNPYGGATELIVQFADGRDVLVSRHTFCFHWKMTEAVAA